jgi:hypothetical protein
VSAESVSALRSEEMEQAAGLDGNRPRVLLGHSSHDQDRFVAGFAVGLREHGIDVRYAEWELLPGDSLVERIFEQSLVGADVFLIVLSRYSLNSGWIREEMDTAALRQIEERCRVIPILLDSCDVPEVLMHTLWQRIQNVHSYRIELEGIVRAIRGGLAMPRLDEAPAPSGAAPIPGLQSVETLVLRVVAETAIETDGRLVDPHSLLDALDVRGVGEIEALQSLDILEEQGYVEVGRTIAMAHDGIRITTAGLHEFAANFLPDYEQMIDRAASYLVLEGRGTDRAIAGELRKPRVLVENILDLFAAQDWIEASKVAGPTTYVHSVSPELSKELWS